MRSFLYPGWEGARYWSVGVDGERRRVFVGSADSTPLTGLILWLVSRAVTVDWTWPNAIPHPQSSGDSAGPLNTAAVSTPRIGRLGPPRAYVVEAQGQMARDVPATTPVGRLEIDCPELRPESERAARERRELLARASASVCIHAC